MKDPKGLGGWRGELGRMEGRAAHDTLSDQVTAFRIFFRLLLFPFWLPFYFVRVQRRRKEMIIFALEQSRNRIHSEGLAEEISIAWVKMKSDRYPLGEYDPRFTKVRRTFQSILDRNRNRA
ncbi:MAG: hypothetical protein IH861_14935 [Chloroflexi bacterium]|nr:hypothetical protein [Chloroflexota bacterium]